MHRPITGETLKLARIIYGYNSQEELGKKLNVSLGTVQRYEAMDIVDDKTAGIYILGLNFELQKIADFVFDLKMEKVKNSLDMQVVGS